MTRDIGRIAFLGVMAGLLAGCAAQGRPRVVSQAGDPLVARKAAANGIYSQFQQAAEDAYPDDIGNPPPLAVQRRFMQTGFELINVTCAAYIEGKADRQRTLNVWRDSFAPITVLATGVFALARKGEKVDSDELAALALLTSGANAGFEIYEQRYLFGAKNVDNVRRLVLKAQLEHAETAMRLTETELTYSGAVRYLRENQMVCSPGAILELVSKAIDAGEITGVPTAKPAGAAAVVSPAHFNSIELKVGN